jgi:hypothetical protein
MENPCALARVRAAEKSFAKAEFESVLKHFQRVQGMQSLFQSTSFEGRAPSYYKLALAPGDQVRRGADRARHPRGIMLKQCLHIRFIPGLSMMHRLAQAISRAGREIRA